MPFVVGFGVALVLTPAAIWLGRAVGLVDVGAHPLKIHQRPTPLSGGIAVAAALGIASQIGNHRLDWLVAGGFLLALAVGVVDDLLELPPAFRLVLLAVAGVLLAFGAVSSVQPWPLLGIVLVAILSANAVNMVDGQDGLAGGLGAIAALALAVVSVAAGRSNEAVIGFVLAGSLAGFLVWNYPRASVFLGDGGAYLVGFVLAFQAISITAALGFLGLIVSGAALGIFALEFAITFYRRAFVRTALTRGDRFHSYDLLSKRFRRMTVTAVFWGIGLILGAVAVALSRLPLEVAVVGGLIGAVICGMSALSLTKAAKTSSLAQP
jgi:UDP-GlcNAc:undecaprenyl-phosphate GlcNAc-1-phosphate transferase